MTTELTTVAGDAETIVRVAQEACDPADLEPGRIYAWVANGRVHEVDLTGDEYRDTPRRKSGVVTVTDVPSFLTYWDKHRDETSEVYADRTALTVTAVLDAHGRAGAAPGWCEHRVHLALRHTDSFTAWSRASAQPMSQVAFAEFIEDHRPDVVSPAAADLMELAQTFQATAKAAFRSQSILKSGQRELSYVEQIDATAGRDGKLTIPDKLDLALKIFEGAEVADAVTARLRYRITDNRLALIIILDQVREVVDAAFEGILAGVDEGVDVPILRGRPA